MAVLYSPSTPLPTYIDTWTDSYASEYYQVYPEEREGYKDWLQSPLDQYFLLISQCW